MKPIEDASNLFLQHTMAAKYFLFKCGLFVKEYDFQRVKLYGANGINNDHLFHSMHDFKGFGSNKSGDDKNTQEVDTNLKVSLDATIGLLNDKLIIDDFMLILCFQYCFNNGTNDKELVEKYLKALEDCVYNCLSQDTSSILSYYYFKEFLLFSSYVYTCNLCC